MNNFKLMAAAAMAMGAAGQASAADIEFWYGNTGNIETAIQANCEAFNASQSEHKVTCVGQGSYEEGMQKAIAAYRSNTHPVLVQFFDVGTLDLMLSDAVVPVEDLMPNVDWDSYIPGARSYYETSDGRLFSQPYNSSTLLFYANMTTLRDAGITEMPTTWEEVMADAQILKDAGHACPFATDGHPWRVLEQFASRHGIPVASNHNGYDGLDAEYVFNTGLIAQHLQNLADWREQGLVRLAADTVAGNYTAAFNAGECAMVENSSGSYTAAREAFADKFELGVAMAPMYAGQERHNTFVGGASIWAMKGHDEAEYEAAQAFLTFLRSPEPQLAFVAATGYVPVTAEALAVLDETGQIDDPLYGTAKIGIDSMSQPGNADTRGLRLGFYVQFRDVFTEETQKAFNGEKSMQQALDEAKARGDELLRRFEATYRGVKLP